MIFAVELRRGVDVVVVVVEARVLQFARLVGIEHAERRAGFHAERAHFANHRRDRFDVALLRRTPGGAHAEARRARILRGLARACAPRRAAPVSRARGRCRNERSAGSTRNLPGSAPVLIESSVLICTALAGWFARWVSCARNMRSAKGSWNSASTSSMVQSWRTVFAGHSIPLTVDLHRVFRLFRGRAATKLGACSGPRSDIVNQIRRMRLTSARRLSRALAATLFPPRCGLCGFPGASLDLDLCEVCHADLPWAAQVRRLMRRCDGVAL